MPDANYLISCAVSSVGGLIVGLFAGAALNGKLSKVTQRIWAFLHHPNIIALQIAIVVIGSMVMVFLQSRELDRVTACQTNANEAFRQSLVERSAASSGQRDAQIEQIIRQIEQNQGQAQLLATTVQGVQPDSIVAIRAYTAKLDANTAALEKVLTSLQRAKATTTQNPYPPLKCGDPQRP